MASKSADDIDERILSFFNGDDLAAEVFKNKYALRDLNDRVIETPTDMFRREAREFARIEAKYFSTFNTSIESNGECISEKDIFDALNNFKRIVPQGSPMYGIGNNNSTSSLGNCIVIGNKTDSIGSIQLIDCEQALLMKERAGVGHDLSHLRPRGSKVSNAAKSSSGATSFMDRYSHTTREIAQGGRRGALMLTIEVTHPDIEEFIQSKQDLTKITGANISVKITDDFMRAVEADGNFPLVFNGKTYKTIKARKLWDQIIHNAWSTAEPGVLFWDKIKRESPADCYPGFQTVSTNPCGEIPLCPYDSCRLMVVVLYSYVVNPFTKDAYFDFQLFIKDVELAMRLMDDLIDLEEEKINKIIMKMEASGEDPDTLVVGINLWKKIKKTLLDGRRTGLGITGEGDMLAALGYRYGSNESIQFAEKVHKTKALTAYRTSVILAKERGPFPAFDFAKENSEFVKRLFAEDPQLKIDMEKYGRRNIAILTIAPTGTVSIMTQTTSGIEPAFLVNYKRNRKIHPNDVHNLNIDKKKITVDAVGDKWIQYTVLHHKFLEWMRINGHQDANIEDEKVLQELIKKSPYFGSVANDIDYIKKTELQGTIQKWVDHSISVTINMPSSVTKEQVNDVYISAWKWGCKGCTVYRDGCRSGVLVAPEKKTQDAPKKRPKTLKADIVRFNNGKEKWVAFVGLFDGKPYEIFTGKSADIGLPVGVKTGTIVKTDKGYDFHYGLTNDATKNTKDTSTTSTTTDGVREGVYPQLDRCFDPQYWNYAILLSHMLRLNQRLDKLVDIVRALKFTDNSESINTWKAGVVRALSKYIPSGTMNKQKCTCGENYTYQEGCLICTNCGNSKCS